MHPYKAKTLILWLILLITGIFLFLQTHVQSYYPDKHENMGNIIEINEKINPNTADWPSLARLPGIGVKRAKDIINYRNKQNLYDNTSTVFTDYTDLAKINGIGKITCDNIRGYLIFK